MVQKSCTLEIIGLIQFPSLPEVWTSYLNLQVLNLGQMKIIPIQLSCKTVWGIKYVGKVLGNVESIVGMMMIKPVKLKDPHGGRSQEASLQG